MGTLLFTSNDRTEGSRFWRWSRLAASVVIASQAAIALAAAPSQQVHAASAVFTGDASQRIVDTRPNSGLSPTGALTDGQVLTVNLGTSRSVVLNVTAVGPTGNGYLTVFPCGQPRPNTSTVNFASATTANLAIATPNSGGNACVFARVDKGGAVHIVVDKYGVLNGAPFQGQTPSRRLDTRSSGGKVNAGASRSISGIPAHAAVALNLTVTQPEGGGYLAAYPCAEGFHNTSNLNFTKGETRAVLSVVRADSAGKVCIRSSVRAHMVIDQMGVFASDPAADIVSPARLVDSRNQLGGKYGNQFSIDVDSIRSASGEVFKGRGRAAILNMVAVSPKSNGYITVWPCARPRPKTSLLNFEGGRYATSNAVVVQPDSSGKICVWSSTSIHLVVDLAGFINTSAPSAMKSYEPRTDCVRGSLSFANAERRRLGRSAVTWDDAQFKKACAWAHKMAYDDRMHHWTWPGFAWAEIVAYGWSRPANLEGSWMNSPPHRAIIVDPAYKGAAIAYVPVDQQRDKKYWGVGQFHS